MRTNMAQPPLLEEAGRFAELLAQLLAQVCSVCLLDDSARSNTTNRFCNLLSTSLTLAFYDRIVLVSSWTLPRRR